MDRPIPSFYCVYLLRSIAKPGADPYVGSTPNPCRRLKQHNVIIKGGGSKRTAYRGTRPWDMAITVAGFPSKIAALQFEWSWQHTHLTRHIPKEQRITDRHNPRKRRKDKSLKDHLLNLELLLRMKAFDCWPLNVRFYCKKTYDEWIGHLKRLGSSVRNSVVIEVDEGALKPASLPTETKDFAQDEEAKRQFLERPNVRALYGLDVTYKPLKPHVHQSLACLANPRSLSCAVCNKVLDKTLDKIVVCSNEVCHAPAHLTCLATHFLAGQHRGKAMLPINGKCPKCTSHLAWSDLVKDLSLRMRGSKEVSKLFKERKNAKISTQGDASNLKIHCSPQASKHIPEHRTASMLLSDIPIQEIDTDIEDGLASDDDDEYDASFAQVAPDLLEQVADEDVGSETEPLPLPKAHNCQTGSAAQQANVANSYGGVVADSECDDVEEVT